MNKLSQITVPVFLIAIACARLYPTYTTFTGTTDEPIHIAAGLEWLDKGLYTYDRQHPPLARIAVALGPYLDGIVSDVPKTDRRYPLDFLFLNGGYFRNLTLARMGNLPFLILMCIVVYLWGSLWFNRSTALWALLLFTCLPPILGHSAVATVDAACAATVAAALYTFLRWLERPELRQAVLLGAAVGLALLSKFSSFVFLPVCVTAAIVLLAIANRNVLLGAVGVVGIRKLAISTVIAFFLVWGAYRFSVTAWSPSDGQRQMVDSFALPVPLLEVKEGIDVVADHNASGHPSYLLGEFRTTGWWYFFPVVVAVKTPLPFLILTAIGVVAALRSHMNSSWQKRLTVIFPVAILLACMTSRINLGVRHILSIYPMMAILAGFGITWLTRKLQRRTLIVAACLLPAWVIVDSVVAHPDYLAYFNQIGSRHPEAILCESDLDWGQDLHRLSARLRALEVKEVAIRYFGTFPLDRANLPVYRDVPSEGPISGYVAISLHYLVLQNARDGSFNWLKQFEPIEVIGKSIYLFHIVPS
jgi:hypothetical protein